MTPDGAAPGGGARRIVVFPLLRFAATSMPSSSPRGERPGPNRGIKQNVGIELWKGAEVRLDVINLFDEVYRVRNGTGVGVEHRNSVRAAWLWPG